MPLDYNSCTNEPSACSYMYSYMLQSKDKIDGPCVGKYNNEPAGSYLEEADGSELDSRGF